MPNRTRIVCLHEGEKGRSIDPLFINALLRVLDPAWLRPWSGSNLIRPVDCGGRSNLIARIPEELKACLSIGSDTTLMVWADLDHDMDDPDTLKKRMWEEALGHGISNGDFDRIVFVFAKDRLENWIEFLNAGKTNELVEGPRVKYPKEAVEAAKKLAALCQSNANVELPPSLRWSCQNWQKLVRRMK